MRARMLVGITVGFWAALAVAQTSIPSTLGYQGQLLDSVGDPVVGVLSVTFEFYEQAEGGTKAWAEVQDVSVGDGYFSVQLGKVTSFPDDLFRTSALYLQLTIGGDALLPRLPLSAVGAAFVARDLIGGIVDASSIAVAGAPVINAAGEFIGPADNLINQVVAAASAVDGVSLNAATLGGVAAADYMTEGEYAIAFPHTHSATELVSGFDVFAAKVHDHTASQITDGLDVFGAKVHNHTASQITDGLDVFAAKGHSHPLSEITDRTPPLVERMGTAAHRGKSWVDANVWSAAPGMVAPFYAAGGPVMFTTSIPLVDGSHSSCRPMIDGMPAGMYNGHATTYRWQEGLSYSAPWWRMWNNSRIYPGIAPGWHTAAIECFNDSISDSPRLGDAEMVRTFSVLPFEPPADAEVKAYTVSLVDPGSLTASSYQRVTGLELSFEAQGGPVRITVSVPISSAAGSHSTCRPLVNGVAAGTGDIDDTSDGWEEGLTYTANNWAMWNRTRVYTKIAAGSLTATVECRTDAGSHDMGDWGMSAQLGVVTYLPADDSDATVHAYAGVESKVYILPAGSWVTLSGLKTTITSNGGPVEIGTSVSITAGSYSACRPTLDGSHIFPGQPDLYSAAWQNGINYSGYGWGHWDRIRVYEDIPAGTHEVGVQCRNDSGTAYAGRVGTVSHVWAIAYDE